MSHALPTEIRKAIERERKHQWILLTLAVLLAIALFIGWWIGIFYAILFSWKWAFLAVPCLITLVGLSTWSFIEAHG